MNTSRSRFAQAGWISVCVMLAVLVSTVRAQTPSSGTTGGGGGPINTMCPVTTDEPIDPRFTVEYEGVTVGLCCRRCRTKFEDDPAAYVANLPASFVPAAAEQEHDADAHEPTERPTDDGHTHTDEESDTGDASEDGHDHATDHDTAKRSKIAVWIGKFHPPATHLPIGLLIGAAIAEACMIATGRSYFRHAAGFCLALAAASALVAAGLGWFNAGITFWEDDWLLATHRWLGASTTTLSVLALIVFARANRQSASSRAVLWYRGLLFLTAGLVGATGFFGGALVYGINHYAW
ncbi:MAG: hypothetical protein NCW75_11400 [Phycisphaera sp.]|nr:MAG: hypothetical protein NCW75_11400 [Phycisphaera sp.]